MSGTVDHPQWYPFYLPSPALANGAEDHNPGLEQWRCIYAKYRSAFSRTIQNGAGLRDGRSRRNMSASQRAFITGTRWPRNSLSLRTNVRLVINRGVDTQLKLVAPFRVRANFGL
jgi:hypothetical protein